MKSRTTNAAGTAPRAGTRLRGKSARAEFDLLQRVVGEPSLAGLFTHIEQGRRIIARGGAGSSASVLAAATARRTDRLVILACAHLDEADHSTEEIRALGVDATLFPALEVLPGETEASLELIADRLRAVAALHEHSSGAHVFVCPVQALMQPLPSAAKRAGMLRTIARGDTVDREALLTWLTDAGYRRIEALEEPGDFAARGGIVDIFPSSGGDPVRIDFFGDEVDALHEVDLNTMGSDRAIDSVDLATNDASSATLRGDGPCLLDEAPASAIAILHETMEVVEQARGYYERARDGGTVFGPPAVLKRLRERFHAFVEINQFSPGAAGADAQVELPVENAPDFATTAEEAVGELAELAQTYDAIVLCQNEGEASRMRELLEAHAPDASVRVVVQFLHRGFLFGEPADGAHPVALIPNHELLHRYHARRGVRRIRAGRAMDAFLDLKPGDYVVHIDHGVGKFVGLQMMKPRSDAARAKKAIADVEEEYLTIEFAGRAQLHVPATQIDKVQKYIGGFKGQPPLSTLGGRQWKKQKEKAAEATRDLAAEMLRVQAARQSMPGVRYAGDTEWQRDFEAEFPYEETEDQVAAISEVKKDMQSPRPMDRLICGDVGFGKTEVAIRAAFKAAEFGKQVAVLAPTTVLVEQHERTFRERFAGYPFKVESVSRFKTGGEAKAILERLAKGQVDIIVGTHRLLSNDVKFADLGLVIIDEEQRFGVEHKQKLLSMRMTVDVLTLSATPIPRTLHMSLLGLRDISSLTTAPMDRRSIVTEVIPYNEQRVKRAIERELAREGQIFYVHNRVHNIKSVADDVRKLAPDARVIVGHGQMKGHELEKVMLTFVRGDADILVSTTIIESGIDIPTANTMIIADADRFGLADLHQLRGRVGRHKHRAYCYLLLPIERTITESAKKRLKAVEEYSMLGAGFRIAMRDLEIRGAGNILGAEQSGHIAAVGYELYCRLLEEAVRQLKNETLAKPLETSVEIGVAGMLPRSYIPSDLRRMEAYRRLSIANTGDELEALERDLVGAYGKPPGAAQRLLDVASVRIGLAEIGVTSVTVFEKDVVFKTDNPTPVIERLEGAQGTVRPLQPKSPNDPWEIYFRPPPSWLEPESLLTVLRRRFGPRTSEAAA